MNLPNELFRTVVDVIPEIIAIVEVQNPGRYVFVYGNAAARAMSGLSDTEVIGKTYEEAFTPQIAGTMKRASERAIAEKIPIEEEDVADFPKGRTNVQTLYIPVLSTDGNCTHIILKIQDITKQKTAEAKIMDHLKQFEQLFDAIPDMILVKGPKSKIVWANKAFRDLYGMTNEQMNGMIDASFNEPDYTQQYIRDDETVFTTGKSLDIPEEPVTRFDGTVRYLHTVKSPIFDDQGNVIMTMGISHDITDRKKTQSALIQSESQFRAVSDASPLGIFVTDTSGNVTYVNRTFRTITGMSESEAFGKGWQKLIHPDDAELVFERWNESLRMHTPYEHIHRYVRYHSDMDHPVWVSVKAAPMKSNNTITGFVGTIEDITARKKTEDEEQEHTKELEHLTQVMIGREVKMAELKTEIESLKTQLNAKP